jgi:diguanylate cyclase (GGDEF)-like protein
MRQTTQRRDPLTRLLNRVALTTDIKANLTAPHYNLLSIRVQNVAEVNQKYGIDYGDVIIKTAAQRVMAFLTDDLLLYRYSGAQFIILGKTEDSLISDKLVQKLKEELSKTIELSDMELVLDVSLSQELNLKRSSLMEALTQLSRKALTT